MNFVDAMDSIETVPQDIFFNIYCDKSDPEYYVIFEAYPNFPGVRATCKAIHGPFPMYKIAERVYLKEQPHYTCTGHIIEAVQINGAWFTIPSHAKHIDNWLGGICLTCRRRGLRLFHSRYDRHKLMCFYCHQAEIDQHHVTCGRCKRTFEAMTKHVSVFCNECEPLERMDRIRQSNKAHSHKRRILLDNGKKDFTSADWQRALEYFNYSCAVCGRPQGFWHTLAQDHWIPVTKRGDHTATNVVPLCHGIDGCNNRKSDSDADKWLIRQYGKCKAAKIEKRIAEYFAQVSA